MHCSNTSDLPVGETSQTGHHAPYGGRWRSGQPPDRSGTFWCSVSWVRAVIWPNGKCSVYFCLFASCTEMVPFSEKMLVTYGNRLAVWNTNQLLVDNSQSFMPFPVKTGILTTSRKTTVLPCNRTITQCCGIIAGKDPLQPGNNLHLRHD